MEDLVPEARWKAEIYAHQNPESTWKREYPMDTPAVYFGWYAKEVNGPFLL